MFLNQTIGTTKAKSNHKSYFRALDLYEQKKSQNLLTIASSMNSNTHKPEQCKKTE